MVLLFFVLAGLTTAAFMVCPLWAAVGLVSWMSAVVTIGGIILAKDDNNEEHTMENGRAPN